MHSQRQAHGSGCRVWRMVMSETKTVTYTLHRDPDGYPTCASRWDGARCALLLVRGTRLGGEQCGATGDWLVRALGPGEVDISKRYLRPTPGCPLWSAGT
jgi:hypothetical protein